MLGRLVHGLGLGPYSIRVLYSLTGLARQDTEGLGGPWDQRQYRTGIGPVSTYVRRTAWARLGTVLDEVLEIYCICLQQEISVSVNCRKGE